MGKDRYQEFLGTKTRVHGSVGYDLDPNLIHESLFDFQRSLVRWAVRKGRCALFADTGLGKTRMQLEWARLTKERTLILAPLAVAKQTVREGTDLGVNVVYARSQETASHITIANYEMLGHFDPDAFGAVVLDESSILKAHDGKTRSALIEAFSKTPWRLACTATPAPNDIQEIANHAEFLGVLTRTEMLATFFVHDDQGWRLKGHAREGFYKWLASWGMSVKRPSDIGGDDEGFDLPPLTVRPTWVEAEITDDERLFSVGLSGVGGRLRARRSSLDERVAEAVRLIQDEPDERWIAWCGLNDESRALANALGSAAVEVYGAQPSEEKERALFDFIEGRVRVLVTKPSIAGFGLNLQHCARQVFVGLSDSFEGYYQAIRRSWRFGQTRPVEVSIVLSDAEKPILDNVMAKQQEAERMSEELVKHVAQYEIDELSSAHSSQPYATAEAEGDGWKVMLGDSCERMKEIPDDSVGLSVFSPPFQSLYVYSASDRDLGNSGDRQTFWTQFGFIIDELLRITKPGRNAAVHVSQLATTLAAQGVIGIEDFRGATIQNFIDRGWVFHGEVVIDKNPQAQAIRTHSKALLFAQLRKDSSWLRPGLADFILLFRKPGENDTPIHPDISNEDWIEWAHPVWYGIRESDTLNVHEARSSDDERHICPLQLPVIERCIRLWSNPGEMIFSPFTGIGSEGFEAVKHDRRFTGIELKPEYWRVAVRNIQRAEREKMQGRLL